MFDSVTKIPLSTKKNTAFTDIAYDGLDIYLSTSGKQIFSYNVSGSYINHIHTYINCHPFCYDSDRCCFYTIIHDGPEILIRLSKTFEEIDRVLLKELDKKTDITEHLFYDANAKQLYFTILNKIYTVDQSGTIQCKSELKGISQNITGICAFGDHNVICIYSNEQKQYLSLHSILTGDMLENQDISTDFQTISMILIKDKNNPFSFMLRILAVQQNGAPFFVDFQQEPEFFKRYAVSSLTDEKNDSSAVKMQQLGLNQMFCPYYNHGNIRNNCNQAGSNQQKSKNSCPNCGAPMSQCNCGFNCSPNANANCNSGCNSSCRPDCHSYISCHQAFTDIIESIALTETSIAHILNAEGEKLQKAVACCSNISELLKVNESVQKTIIQSTQLEQMLYYKLDAIINADCCDCPCHCSPAPQSCETQLDKLLRHIDN